MATDTTNTITNAAVDSMTFDELDVRTDPNGPAAGDEKALAAFFDGEQSDEGEVSAEELDLRRAEGLTASFDDDDDDLDEDLRQASKTPRDAKDGKNGDTTDGAAPAESEPTDADSETAEQADVGKATVEPASDDAASRRLIETAVRYGLDVKQFPNRAALAASVAAMDRMFHDVGAAAMQAEAAPHTGTPQESEPYDGFPQKAPPYKKSRHEQPPNERGPHDGAPPADPAAEPFKVDRLDRSEYAPELIEALDEMRHVIAELRSEQQVDRRHREASANQAAEREIDSFFTELSQDNPVWTDLFGTAPATELLRTAEGRQLFENRMNVLRARDNYAAGLESRRQPTPASRKLLESGLALAFREKLGEAAERKLAQRLHGRHSGAPPRPTQRQSPRRDGGSALRDALKRHGMHADTEE